MVIVVAGLYWSGRGVGKGVLVMVVQVVAIAGSDDTHGNDG